MVESSVVRIDKFLSVKTLVGFENFVDFVRFYEQFFVGETNCAVISNRQKIVRQNEQNRQNFQSQLTFSPTKICRF
jgi:hypothetical protein